MSIRIYGDGPPKVVLYKRRIGDDGKPWISTIGRFTKTEAVAFARAILEMTDRPEMTVRF